MYEYLTFRRMITPLIIQVLFWVGVAFAMITGLVMIIAGAASHYGGGQQVLGGLFMLILGPVIVRIYCELLILFFRMNETLTEIRDNTRPPALPKL